MQKKSISAKGFKAGGIYCGIKKNGRKDLALIHSDVPCSVAALFTANSFKAPPVIFSQQVVKKGKAQAIVVNSGCANAATGAKGLIDTKEIAKYSAKLFNLSPQQIIIASTGTIGTFLPLEKIKKGINILHKKISEDGFSSAADAILTTDKYAKISSAKIDFLGKKINLLGIIKGAGMIHPKLEATMLAFLVTDAKISSSLLQKCLNEAVNSSFNCISIDGETSTNDMVVVLANGQSKTKEIIAGSEIYQKFAAALKNVCFDLAQKIVLDGEGATKLITIKIKDALSQKQAKEAAELIATSPLVKTAFHGNNPNWGRIFCRLGQSKIRADINKIEINLQGMKVFPQKKINLNLLNQKMRQKEILVEINLHQGKENAFYLTSDFSQKYVRINAQYN